jgi:hypothetical protein
VHERPLRYLFRAATSLSATAGLLLMWNNWIGRRSRGSGRTLLFWGLLLCAGAAGLGWEARDNFSDALARPDPIDAAILTSPEGVNQLSQRFITFRSPEIIDTGATASFANRRDKVRARYVIATAGDRRLLVKVPADHEGTTFTGMLAGVSPDQRENVIGPFAEEEHLEKQLFLPFLVDCTQDTSRGLVAGLFFLTAFLVPGLVLTTIGLRRILRPGTHPLARALQRFGPPATVADTIDLVSPPLRLGPVEFAGDWLICNAPRTGWTVFRTTDLVWVHKLIETVNGVPLHRLKLYDRLGVCFEGRGRPDVIDAAVAAITQRSPWLVIGWDERVAKQWKDDPASLVPRVEERRQELQNRK